MKEYVAGFMFDKLEYSVLLIQKNRPEWQKGMLNAIGGHIENNELPIHAMVREFKEETNIETKETDWKLVCVLEGTDWRVYFYKSISNAIYAAEQLTEEKLQTFMTCSLPNNCIFNLRWLIPFCMDDCILSIPVIKYEDQ